MLTIYTIGHSTRPIEDFIQLLQLHQIQQLVDIRTIPKSRFNPQFMQGALAESIEQAGIRYIYMKNLGGRRFGLKDSPNMGWKNRSFRSFADYMLDPAFTTGINQLMEVATRGVIAIMCSEAVPRRYHRSLVGDALLVRGVQVLDIVDAKNLKPQTLTSFAKVTDLDITYPAEQESLELGLE